MKRIIGFIAHVDTADFEARNIQPNSSKTIIVKHRPRRRRKFVLDPKDFLNLKNYVGQT